MLLHNWTLNRPHLGESNSPNGAVCTPLSCEHIHTSHTHTLYVSVLLVTTKKFIAILLCQPFGFFLSWSYPVIVEIEFQIEIFVVKYLLSRHR
jgi:hypothetical protein